VGGSVHALNFAATPADYFAHANDEILVILQCEHKDAVEQADEIFSVPGIDAIFVGPNDLAASMRDSSGKQPGNDEMTRTLLRILEACRRHGVAPGLHCMHPEEVKRRAAEGWQFLAITSELKMMLDGAALALEPMRGAVKDSAARH